MDQKSGSVIHANSLETLSDSIVVSMRHTDAAYKIDRDSGAIIWNPNPVPLGDLSRADLRAGMDAQFPH